MTDTKTAPLTDEQLARIEETIPGKDDYTDPNHPGFVYGRELMDEVRRLRSDEWLEAAARALHEDWEERADYWLRGEDEVVPGILAILRRHRDGRA